MNVRFEQLEARRLLAAEFPLVIGGERFDIATAAAVDSAGNTIVAGLFSGTVDFQPGTTRTELTSRGSTDIFVAKYTPNGKLVWAHPFGGESRRDVGDEFIVEPLRAGGLTGVGAMPLNAGEYVTGIALDPADNIYLTGAFSGIIDFDPGPGTHVLTSFGEWDIFVLKLTPDGTLGYASQFGGEFNDIGNAIAVDDAGNAYVTGYFTRVADFNPTRAVFNVQARGRDDIFVMKLGATGRLVWVSTMGGDEIHITRRESGNALAIDEVGNVYVTGTFAGVADFAPGPATFNLTSRGETDTFIALLSVNGKLVWAKQIGGEQYDGGLKLARNPAGEIYVGSYFQRTIDVDPGPGVISVEEAARPGRRPAHTDLLISKLTSDGDLIWARPLGGGGYETLGDMKLAPNGDLYITGGFYGSIDFAPGPRVSVLTSTPGDGRFRDRSDRNRRDSYDIYVARYNPSGNLVTAQRFGSASDDLGTAIGIDPRNGNLRVAGRFRGTADFNPSSAFIRNIRSPGIAAAFVSAMSEDLELLGHPGEPQFSAG